MKGQYPPSDAFAWGLFCAEGSVIGVDFNRYSSHSVVRSIQAWAAFPAVVKNPQLEPWIHDYCKGYSTLRYLSSNDVSTPLFMAFIL